MPATRKRVRRSEKKVEESRFSLFFPTSKKRQRERRKRKLFRHRGALALFFRSLLSSSYLRHHVWRRFVLAVDGYNTETERRGKKVVPIPSLFDVKLIRSLFSLSFFLFKPLTLTHYLPDDVNAIVIDIGSATVKAGYAGEDAPKAVYPSVRKETRVAD
jgi:hypothetical protein